MFEVTIIYLQEHVTYEVDYDGVSKLKTQLPTHRKIKVFLHYPDRPELTDDRFEVVENSADADIVWVWQGFKDFE